MVARPVPEETLRPLANSAVKFIRMFEDIEDGCDYLKIIRKVDGGK